MSMLSAQADELRTLASELEQFTEGCIGRTREEHVMLISSVDTMREAADTIMSLRDRLQAMVDIVEHSRWNELFGTPEKAARTLANIATADGCEDCTLLDATCCRNENAWLEWLRGDA